MITKFPIGDRQQWLGLRRNDVTGSEVGALFGVHRYLTPAKLYALKSGNMPEDDIGGGPVTRGVRLESFVASQVAIANPNWSIAKNDGYYRDVENRIGGTPDYFIRSVSIDGSQQISNDGILEVKTVGRSDFLRVWKGGDPEGEIIPEPWQLMQAMTYMYLTGAAFAKVAVLPVGEWEPMDVHVIDVPRRDDTIAAIIGKINEFWNDVDEGIMPDFDFEKDIDVIKSIYANVRPGSYINYRGDNEFREMLQWHQKYADEEKFAKERKEVIAANIRARMGEYESATTDGWDVTLKEQTRKEHITKASTFRVLRLKQHNATQKRIEGL
jgi:predicted phage-related endonuclease